MSGREGEGPLSHLQGSFQVCDSRIIVIFQFFIFIFLFCIYLYFFTFVLLEVEPRALYMQGRTLSWSWHVPSPKIVTVS